MIDKQSTPQERYRDLSTMYDDLFPFDADADATVSFLEKSAAGGRVLELGVGTGRIAIPLAERGCDMTGVDASPDMLAILRSKDVDGKIDAVQADMTAPGLDGEFDLIYTIWNSLFELHTQERQLACVMSAAGLLRDGGRFVVETAVASRAFADQKPLSVGPFDDLNSATFQLIRYDHVNQLVDYRHVLIGPAGITVLPSTHRVIYLSELDLMARLAGLTLVTRQGDWTGGRFDASSGRHISVYEKR